MANIRRYTSPTQELIVEGVDLTSSDVYVTYKQGNYTLQMSGNDITVEAVTHDQTTDTKISVYMSQTQTAGFKSDPSIEVQVNWLTDGQRNATTIAKVSVARNLLEEVIE